MRELAGHEPTVERARTTNCDVEAFLDAFPAVVLIAEVEGRVVGYVYARGPP